jgi:hypothetical protein
LEIEAFSYSEWAIFRIYIEASELCGLLSMTPFAENLKVTLPEFTTILSSTLTL